MNRIHNSSPVHQILSPSPQSWLDGATIRSFRKTSDSRTAKCIWLQLVDQWQGKDLISLDLVQTSSPEPLRLFANVLPLEPGLVRLCTEPPGEGPNTFRTFVKQDTGKCSACRNTWTLPTIRDHERRGNVCRVKRTDKRRNNCSVYLSARYEHVRR